MISSLFLKIDISFESIVVKRLVLEIYASMLLQANKPLELLINWSTFKKETFTIGLRP